MFKSGNEKSSASKKPNVSTVSKRLELSKQPVVKQLPESRGIEDNVKVESSKDYDQVMKIIGNAY